MLSWTLEPWFKSLVLAQAFNIAMKGRDSMREFDTMMLCSFSEPENPGFDLLQWVEGFLKLFFHNNNGGTFSAEDISHTEIDEHTDRGALLKIVRKLCNASVSKILHEEIKCSETFTYVYSLVYMENYVISLLEW